MANTFRNDTYRSGKSLSYIAMATFGSLGLCAGFYIIMSIVVIALPDAAINLADGQSVNIGYGLIGLASIFERFLDIVAVVFFLIWEYRSFNNLSALKASNLEFSPGWAVGWWFVPFFSLVRPFQVIRELWNESDPDFDAETGFLHNFKPTPEIIGFWWAAFLLSGVVFLIANVMIDSKSGIPTDYFPVAFIVANLLRLAAAVLIIYIVKGITQRQEQRFEKLIGTQSFLPPPPSFYQNG